MKLNRLPVFPVTHVIWFSLCFADEPPESNVADVELVAELNNNVTISCNHWHNSTVYQVNLERMPHSQPWIIIGVCKKVEGLLVTEDYTDRGVVSCISSLDVSLHLTDVDQEDGGFYRCRFSTDAGEQTTTVQLTISTPGKDITLLQHHDVVCTHAHSLTVLTRWKFMKITGFLTLNWACKKVVVVVAAAPSVYIVSIVQQCWLFKLTRTC